MGWTARILIAVGIAWALLAPPLFTAGACTKEFDEEAARLERERPAMRTSADARAYFAQRAVPAQAIAPDQCRARKPRFLSRCENGPLVVARVPVSNLICRVYRDDEIQVRLQYDDRDRLARVALDMAPYKSLPLPGTDASIHWAR